MPQLEKSGFKIVNLGHRGIAVAGTAASDSSAPITIGPNRTKSWLNAIAFVVADVVGIVLSWVIAFLVRDAMGGDLDLDLYLRLWPALLLFLLNNAIAGLYPGSNFLPPEEIRRLCYSTTLVFLVSAVAIFLTKESALYSRVTFISAWAMALLFLPLSRTVVRGLFRKREWWGEAIVIFGAGKTGEMVVQMLRDWPSIGLKPIVLLDDDPAKHGKFSGVPVAGPLDLAPAIAKELSIKRAVIAMPGVDRPRLLKIVERHSHSFPHLLIVPDFFGFSSLWVDARDLGGVLCLEIRQNLMFKRARIAKRMADIFFTILLSVIVIPLVVVIAIMIKGTSRGSVLFSHTRVGRGGRPFTAWKFRSMCWNAQQKLDHYLGLHPELREEWERDQKLRDDPRVTWVGKILRRTSLDELPQLWNVIRSEMSLVGPRPIVADEVQRYGDAFELYSKVRPGLTGMWQVSGRNTTTYERRVVLDSYYVRNWSVWLDIYILARTVRVVFGGKGAY